MPAQFQPYPAQTSDDQIRGVCGQVDPRRRGGREVMTPQSQHPPGAATVGHVQIRRLVQQFGQGVLLMARFGIQ